MAGHDAQEYLWSGRVTKRLCGLISLLLLILAGPAKAQEAREIELRYEELTLLGDLMLPEDEKLEGGIVVLTHGTLAHKDMELIEALQAALAERGIASLAHTLSLGINRRRGMYDCAAPHGYLHEEAVHEIAAWVAWLKGQGADGITVMGHSRGGNQVAWYAAEGADEKIAKVVLLAPATGASAQELEARYRARYDAELSPLLTKAQALIAEGKGDTMMRVPGFLYCEDARVRAVSMVSVYGPEPRRDTPTLIPRIGQAVLVVAGSADDVVPDVPRRVRPLVDGKRVRLEIIEDAGHMFLDFFTEDVADLVAGFVAETDG